MQTLNTYVSTKRITFQELRSMAKKRGLHQWYYMDKGRLCEALGIVRVEHLPKYSLTCVETSETTLWRSTCAIRKSYGVHTGKIFYAIKVGRPIILDNVSYIVQRL